MTDHFENQHAKQSLRLWMNMVACSKLIEARIRRNFESEYETTLPRFDVLATLDHAYNMGVAGLTMGELSKRLLVSNGNVTGIVERLHNEGYLSKTKQESDGRRHIVTLSKKGKKYFDTLAQAHEKWVDDILASLDEKQMAHLIEPLVQLKKNITQTNGQKG